MIEVKNLYKSYGNKYNPVLKGFSMKVEKGTIHGVIGHNGSGKTTLIKCLTGIYAPDSGEILIGGQKVFDNSIIKEKIAYVADSNQYFIGYKVKELVKFYQKIYPTFSQDDYWYLNKIFEVDPTKRIRQLSKGQQMRVSFMLNMAINPEVMILDEPTSGLDAMAKRDLLDLLVSTVENNQTTVVISSHHLGELEKICDTMTMIDHGTVKYQDELETVKNVICKYQVVFPKGAPKELFEQPGILNLSNVGSVYTIITEKNDNPYEEKWKNLGAILVEPMEVELEEMFVYMNRGGVQHVS